MPAAGNPACFRLNAVMSDENAELALTPVDGR
jgi:hypothetical protein